MFGVQEFLAHGMRGVGRAQVRNKHSAFSVPATAVAAYAVLHLAATRAFGWKAMPGHLSRPKAPAGFKGSCGAHCRAGRSLV